MDAGRKFSIFCAPLFLDRLHFLRVNFYIKIETKPAEAKQGQERAGHWLVLTWRPESEHISFSVSADYVLVCLDRVLRHPVRSCFVRKVGPDDP